MIDTTGRICRPEIYLTARAERLLARQVIEGGGSLRTFACFDSLRGRYYTNGDEDGCRTHADVKLLGPSPPPHLESVSFLVILARRRRAAQTLI